MAPAQPNQSLIDGLACLQALTVNVEPIGSRELGRMLGLESTRVNRLLKTLAVLGLAQQDAARKYSPGPGIHVLAAQSMLGSGLIRRALGPLESLLSLGHRVAMGVLWQDQVCYLFHADPGDAQGAGVGQARLYPAAESGLGLALLATLTVQEVRDLYHGVPGHAGALQAARFSSAPLGDVELDGESGLLATLETVRTQGYALTRSAGPFGDYRTLALVLSNPATAAIGMSGAFTDDEIPALVEMLRKTAGQIDTVDRSWH